MELTLSRCLMPTFRASLNSMRARIIIGIMISVACSSLVAEQEATQRVKMDDVVYKVGPRYPDRLQGHASEGPEGFE